MSPPDSLPPSTWAAHWCAETVRLYEEGTRRLDDAACLAAAMAQDADDEARLLRRAWCLAGPLGLRPPRLPWQAHARGLAVLVLLLCAFAGGSSALVALGDGTRAVNIAWTWLALLGLPSLSLLAWCLLLPLRRRGAAGAVAVPWRWSWRLRGGPAAELWWRAWWQLGQHSRAPLWLASLLGHALWSAVLAGLLLGLLLALSLRGYQFQWATTILPPAAFAEAVRLLGWLPAQFGFAMPDPASILASGHAPLADDPVRRQWSSWLLGNLVVYGLLPRLLAAAACLVGWRRALARMRLAPESPYYLALRERLRPATVRLGVVDPDREASEAPAIGPRAGLHGQRAVMVGLELADAAGRPQAPPGVDDLGDVDSREQRHAALAAIAAAPARRALLLVDVRRSPDRGSLRFIAEFSRDCGLLAVGLLATDPARAAMWQAALAERGLDPARIGPADAARLRWLTEEA